MNITGVIIRNTFKEGRLKAAASIVIDHDFAVHDLKVFEGIERTFVAMPNHHSKENGHQGISHSIITKACYYIEKCVPDAYYKKINTENINDIGNCKEINISAKNASSTPYFSSNQMSAALSSGICVTSKID